ncbi:Ulp1 protease carboxy-terminal domain isoform A [Chlorella sorokiniana]|uniref:Ulp1 protease carboxy-terminal domain isoform A n=1 Tax=Chlorella sorokiniana TaxID=3076 RepID=A0A2P6U297_CHLSO|nr:Ulp1 protease carboxy-terminal domain isoform A [Chlorella sorokiniana]|eukprot:PRW60429.1 Ulp1 protease carboxy-terminal domain isoform A [Chlorella sorokiniana]
MPAVEPPGGAACEGESAFTLEDIDSLLPGRCITLPVIEGFFRSQFAECLKDADAEHNLEACLVFGPDTWADLRRLLLPGDGEAGAGQQGFTALEHFCRDHDIGSKQYLLLPLLTPSHGSLLVVCQPACQQSGDVAAVQARSQHPCILHLDSLSAQGSMQGHQPDCQALIRFLQPYLGAGHQAWTEELGMVTASVPQQGVAGLGATFMCTSALYFVANLPASVDAAEVERLKSYKWEPMAMFEGSEASCYPGFLTTMWYPRNVPEALRKLLLGGIISRLQGQGGASATSSLLEQAGRVQQISHTASKRPFEMPAERRSRQLQEKQRRQLAAGRRLWGQQGGWTSASGATCRQGWWSIDVTEELKEELRYGDGPIFEFADVQHMEGTPGQFSPPKPQEFDFCFGVELGQQPPPLVIHYTLRVSRWCMPVKAARMAAPGSERQRLKVQFVPAPRAPGRPGGWCFKPGTWERLCDYLSEATGPGCTLHLVQRPAAASHKGLPTAKGAKRLRPGSDGLDDRQARLTVRGFQYHVGVFPTGAAAATAEDLMVIWRHGIEAGWDKCWELDKALLESLHRCGDSDSLRQRLQQYLSSDQGPPDSSHREEPAREEQAAEQQPSSEDTSEQQESGSSG